MHLRGLINEASNRHLANSNVSRVSNATTWEGRAFTHTHTHAALHADTHTHSHTHTHTHYLSSVLVCHSCRMRSKNSKLRLERRRNNNNNNNNNRTLNIGKKLQTKKLQMENTGYDMSIKAKQKTVSWVLKNELSLETNHYILYIMMLY